MNVEVDHLVVGARTLDEGVAWCEATLGITPGLGGRHALMSTHNRLANLSSATFPRSYLEIIAIDPQAPPPGRARWYDLDDEAMHARLTRGPRLIHWVARSSDLRAHLIALAAAGVDRGEALRAERDRLRWHISVRPDGQRLCDGGLPTLIEWGTHHPCDDMPPSGVSLQALVVEGLAASALPLLHAEGMHMAAGTRGRLRATLSTPRGAVELASND